MNVRLKVLVCLFGFWNGPFLKSFIDFVLVLLLCFPFFACKACGILAPQLRLNPMTPHHRAPSPHLWIGRQSPSYQGGPQTEGLKEKTSQVHIVSASFCVPSAIQKWGGTYLNPQCQGCGVGNI